MSDLQGLRDEAMFPQQGTLLPEEEMPKHHRLSGRSQSKGATVERLTRLDIDNELRARLLPYCRLRSGDSWICLRTYSSLALGYAMQPIQ